MGKNRPFVPPPILTPPSVVVPREAATNAIQAALVAGVEQVATMAPTPPAPALAVVPPPAPPVARVELLADRIVLHDPTIKLRYHIFLFPKTPQQRQTNELTPTVATIMHGALICEELEVLLPLADFTIQTR